MIMTLVCTMTSALTQKQESHNSYKKFAKKRMLEVQKCITSGHPSFLWEL